MKRTDINPIDVFSSALIGMELSMNMIVIAAHCNTDDKISEGFIKLNKVYQKYDNAVHKALKAKKLSSPAVISSAKEYISELNDFKKHPDAQTDDIQELIEEQKRILKAEIHPEHCYVLHIQLHEQKDSAHH